MKIDSFCQKTGVIISITFLSLLFGTIFPATYSFAAESTTKSSFDKKTEEKTEILSLPPVKLTPEAVQERIDDINQMPELSVDSKKKIIVFYEEAQKSLKRRQSAIQQTAKYTDLINEDSSIIGTNNGNLQMVRPNAIEQKAKSMALTDIESRIAELQTQLGVEQTNLELTKKLQDNAINKPLAIRKVIASHETKLAKLQSQLDNPQKNDGSPREIRAKRTSIRAKCAALKAELNASEKAAGLSKDKMTLVNNKLARLSRKVARYEKLINTWGKIKETRLSDIGFMELRQNNSLLKQLNNNSFSNVDIDFLKKMANRNIEIAKIIITVGRKENEADKALEILQARQKRMENDFAITSRRIKMMGLTRKSGQLLQAKRGMLLTSRADPEIAKTRNESILTANLNSDDIVQEAQNYLPFKYNIYQELEKLEGKIPEEENNSLTTSAFMLLESYRKLLEDSGKNYTRYIKTLNEQTATQKKINGTAIDFKDYINQRLLWTSSSGIFTIGSLVNSSKAVHWLLDSSNWKIFIKDIHTSFIRKPTIWILIILAFIVSILLQFLLPKQINRINEFASQPKKDSAGRTIAVTILTILQAICIPLTIYAGALYISKMNAVHLFSRAICNGIIKATIAAIIFIIIIYFSKENGIGVKNFQWSKKLCSVLKKYIIFFLIITIPMVFLVVTVQNGPLGINFRSTLGRSLFILLTFIMLLFVVIGFKKIRSSKFDAKFVEWLKKNYVWVNAVPVTILLALIILSATGYYFTAYEFSLNITHTFQFLVIFLLVKEVLHRIVFLSQLQIAYKKAETERKAERERRKLERQQQGLDIDVTEDLNIDIIDTIIGNEELNEQTFKLINFILLIAMLVGIVIIWSDTFPSIQFLNNVVVWNSKVSTAADGTFVLKAISLLNFLQAIFVFVCTTIIVKNLPAIIEIIFFRGKKAHPGTRHAFTLISKYIVTCIGFFLGLKFMGVGWAQFQYMAAAMTVGLSFGLKDIFANFVSGIIILIERPIRLGDSVTVGGSSGVVSKIRIRSTTITTFDRHELIVPNMAFLSEKIVNWSLSDKIMRVVIEIGIGYNSNAKEAEKILLEIANDNTKVLATPPSSVVFVGFGADSLDFKLRVYVNLSDQMTAQHQIRHEINKRFNEAGIEIPFAQRDIHINADEGPLKIQVVGKEKL